MKKLLKDLAFTYPAKFFSTTVIVFANLIDLTYPAQRSRVRTTWIDTLGAIFFVLLVFAGDRILSEAFQSINLSSKFRYSRLYDSRAQSDIVLIGNSRGHTLYQPMIRELTPAKTINLSYNALPTSVARAMVEDYYDLYAPPGKMIIEVSMLIKTDSSVISEFKPYMKQSKRLETIINNVSPRTATACMISNMYLFNSNMFHRSLYYLKKDDSDWILDKKINAGLINDIEKVDKMIYEITEDRMSDFLTLIGKAKEKGTEVTLILAPYYPPYLGKVNNLEDFINEVEESSGLAVYDYSAFVSKDEFFSDYMHLNKAGSRLFIQKMREDGIL